MEKATFVNNICKDFFRACDKLTSINNRELLYDLNTYVNNVRIILHACNNYLKVLTGQINLSLIAIFVCPVDRY